MICGMICSATWKNCRSNILIRMRHGDIMSVYTNDIDTLRQVISQSIPQFLSSLFTIVSVFFSMIVMSVPLTLVTLMMVVVMQFALQKIMRKSVVTLARSSGSWGKKTDISKK